jgi:hypothetical protein
MDILPLFCDIGDFCLLFEPAWRRRLLTSGLCRRRKHGALSLSEVMTILVLFHASGYRDLKSFHTRHVSEQMAAAFPKLVSYNRFVELQRDALVFVDATTPAVCHNLRIPQHKVFWDSARRGQSSMGWFYGFKLHLVINDRGEMLGCYLTPGNVDDRKPVAHMVKDLRGRLFGDKGYISQPLATLLAVQDLRLVTRLRKDMKNKFSRGSSSAP